MITIGIKESLRVNLVLVGIKLFIVLFVIIAGLFYINPANYSPFIPPATGGGEAASSWLTQPLIQFAFGLEPTAYGVGGIFAGAALVFFAYIGFDVVATTAEEAKNPQRDLPIGIIASLIICTILYCAVALVITGMVKYDQIDPKAALATAFTSVGKPGFATLIAAGAVAGLTTVVLTLMIGASRVLFAMSRDHLMPPGLSKVHPKFKTPYVITIGIGILAALIAGLTPIGKLEEMVNIGTLTAFILVSIGVIVLRRKRPDLPRSFKVPWVPFLPILSALICFYLTINLSVETWLRFVIWMALGFIFYFSYGHRKSRLATGETLAEMHHTEAYEVVGRTQTRPPTCQRLRSPWPSETLTSRAVRPVRRRPWAGSAGRSTRSEIPSRSRYGVIPPLWNGQPAPRIRHRSMSIGAATTPSREHQADLLGQRGGRPLADLLRRCSASRRR